MPQVGALRGHSDGYLTLVAERDPLLSPAGLALDLVLRPFALTAGLDPALVLRLGNAPGLRLFLGRVLVGLLRLLGLAHLGIRNPRGSRHRGLRVGLLDPGGGFLEGGAFRQTGPREFVPRGGNFGGGSFGGAFCRFVVLEGAFLGGGYSGDVQQEQGEGDEDDRAAHRGLQTLGGDVVQQSSACGPGTFGEIP